MTPCAFDSIRLLVRNHYEVVNLNPLSRKALGSQEQSGKRL